MVKKYIIPPCTGTIEKSFTKKREPFGLPNNQNKR